MRNPFHIDDFVGSGCIALTFVIGNPVGTLVAGGVDGHLEDVLVVLQLIVVEVIVSLLFDTVPQWHVGCSILHKLYVI